MKSIRSFLIYAILSSITLISFLSALNGYRDSLEKAEQLFDSELVNKAYLLSSTFSYSIDKHIDKESVLETFTAKKKESKQPLESTYLFQIWNRDHLLLRSFNAPVTPLARFESGFQDNNFSQYRWRTFSYYNKSVDLWIITADRVDIRYILAENIVLETILPLVLMLPIIALLIWLIIRYGLSPLKQLSAELSNKRADDLSPLSIEQKPDELIQVVSSVNDLFHRLKTSFLREKRFASDAAHELRTPISAIKIHLYNLKCSIEQSADDHNMHLLTLSVDRMEHLVEQILNLNRISPEQYMANFKELDLYALAQDIIIREYEPFNKKNLQIELQGEHCHIHGDLLSLDVLLQNLLTNARKYTPEGGSILVSLSCKQGAEKQKQIQLQVQNTGAGVPEEQYERLFDRFYRSHGDRHDSGRSGCGLGLAIVKQIAELHHADIVIDKAEFCQDPQKKGFMVTLTFKQIIKQRVPDE